MDAAELKKLQTLIRLARLAKESKASQLARLQEAELATAAQIDNLKTEPSDFSWDSSVNGGEKARRTWTERNLRQSNIVRAQLAAKIELAKREYQVALGKFDVLERMYQRQKAIVKSGDPGEPYL